MNGLIRSTRVRVVAADGEMLGEMETERAQALANDAGLDLVEVGGDAVPPVCRIMDYSKSQYEKRKKSTGPKPSRSQLKQIRLRVKIGQHDVDVKLGRARKFLEQRHKVKLNVMFRGRENAHHDLGRELLHGIMSKLGDIASVEQPPMMEGGRAMSALLSPLPQKN
jgi:translation initiation factor IF-3